MSAVPLDVAPERCTKGCSPRFRPVIALGAKVQKAVARQGGREIPAPRRYVTDPFHPLGPISICSSESFVYVYIKVYQFFLPSGT